MTMRGSFRLKGGWYGEIAGDALDLRLIFLNPVKRMS